MKVAFNLNLLNQGTLKLGKSCGPSLTLKEVVLKMASLLTVLDGRRLHNLPMLNASHMGKREN